MDGGVVADGAGDEGQVEGQVGRPAHRAVGVLHQPVHPAHVAAEEADLGDHVHAAVQVGAAAVGGLLAPGGAEKPPARGTYWPAWRQAMHVEAPDGARVQQGAGEAQVVAVEEVLGDEQHPVGELPLQAQEGPPLVEVASRGASRRRRACRPRGAARAAS